MNLLHRHPPLRALGLRHRRGKRSDYASLARFHYRAGPPASIDRLLTIADRAGRPIALLIASLPTLNAHWRTILWPGRFDDPDPARRARALGRSLRTISRLIVDPRYRGLGLATRLVRRYLRTARVPCVEAPAALARWCPCFTAAGMSAFLAPPSRRDAPLLRLLYAHRTPPHLLLDPRCRSRLARDRTLIAAARRWADASRATRSRKHDPPAALLSLIAHRLHPRRTVFHWSRHTTLRP